MNSLPTLTLSQLVVTVLGTLALIFFFFNPISDWKSKAEQQSFRQSRVQIPALFLWARASRESPD